MGGGGSKEAQLSRFGHLLTAPERRTLELAFLAIAGAQEAKAFSKKQFITYLLKHNGLPQEVASGLYRALAGVGREPSPDQVTFPDFIQHGSHLLKGSHAQRSQRLHLLCSGHASSMQEALHAFLELVLSKEEVLPHLGVWPSAPDSVRAVTDHLTRSLTGSSEGLWSVDELETWLTASPTVSRIFDVTFALCFYREVLSPGQTPVELLSQLGLPSEEEGEEGERRLVTDRTLVPLKTQHPLYPGGFSSVLLNRASLLVINGHLPVEVRGQLCPLFSSVHHGESFSTMCKALVGRGPTLLVVRDQQGHVFGGFAAESWQFGPQFTGGTGCFLFSLSPSVGVYSSTGYNQNYMYLQQNAQTLPNGLGMGGQLDYFGLWLSADYGTGHSRGRPQCTTFGSPVLSGSEEFQLDVVEVWGVGTPHIPESESAGKPSILDKDKVASALLEMAGKTRHSEGLREPAEDSS